MAANPQLTARVSPDFAARVEALRTNLNAKEAHTALPLELTERRPHGARPGRRRHGARLRAGAGAGAEAEGRARTYAEAQGEEVGE